VPLQYLVNRATASREPRPRTDAPRGSCIRPERSWRAETTSIAGSGTRSARRGSA